MGNPGSSSVVFFVPCSITHHIANAKSKIVKSHKNSFLKCLGYKMWEMPISINNGKIGLNPKFTFFSMETKLIENSMCV